MLNNVSVRFMTFTASISFAIAFGLAIGAPQVLRAANGAYAAETALDATGVDGDLTLPEGDVIEVQTDAGALLGEIRFFAGNFAPRGWQFCNGQNLAIADNQALFAVIGTSYGGDGRTSFKLPDMRGRMPLHVGGPQGQGPGLRAYNLGQMGGGIL